MSCSSSQRQPGGSYETIGLGPNSSMVRLMVGAELLRNQVSENITGLIRPGHYLHNKNMREFL